MPVTNEPDQQTAEGARAAAAERARRATLVEDPEVPVLSDNGRPRACPSCGGASVYALHMAMEGRACRYASKGDAIIAYYCGEHERKRESFDIDLHADTRAADIGDWNIEVLQAVKRTASEVVRDVYNLRDLARAAMAHIGELSAELATSKQALLESRAAELKLLAAVPAKAKRRKKGKAKR